MEPGQQLIIEQLKHLATLQQAEFKALRSHMDHIEALATFRLAALEEQAADHETRIRAATEGVTQFKLFSGLASGGSSVMALIALLKAFLGI